MNIEPPTFNAQHPIGSSGESEVSNPATGRLSVQPVERRHRLPGGDGRVEGMILRFIADRYGAEALLQLPPHVVREILKRSADFIQVARVYCEPERRF